MSNFTQVGEFDPTSALQDISRVPFWNWLTLRKQFPTSEHRQVDDIILRFAPIDRPLTQEAVFEGMENVNYFTWYAMPGIACLVEEFAKGRQIGRVLVAALRPGGRIKAHRDEGAYSDAHTRTHFALTSSPECLFTCGSETISMPSGTVWEFNHHEVHSVINDSDEPRIHIIADYL